MHQIKLLITCFVIASFSCNTNKDSHVQKQATEPTPSVTNQSAEIKFNALFTSGINKNQPVNDLTEIPLSFDKVYLFINWEKIPPGNHSLKWNVLNHNNKIVAKDSLEFNIGNHINPQWIWYNFNHRQDQAGTWVFKVWLNDKHIISDPFTVLSYEESSKINKADWLADNFFPGFIKADSLKLKKDDLGWQVKKMYQSPAINDEIGCVRIMKYKDFLRVFFIKETEEGAELYEAFKNGYAKFIDDIFISIYDPLNNYNLIADSNRLYYFTDSEKQNTFYFDLEKNTIKSVKPTANIFQSYNPYQSQDGMATINKDCRNSVVNINHSQQIEQITQLHCLGNYGAASWENNHNVYFDLDYGNSGIWEFNLEKKKLQQIVYANQVMHPYYFSFNNEPFVSFINRSSIKIASPSAHYPSFDQDFDPENAHLLIAKSYFSKGTTRLKVNLYKNKTPILAYCNEVESGDSIFIYQIGEINNTHLDGGILYRADKTNASKDISSWSSLRFVKKDHHIYFLQNASSGSLGTPKGNTQIAFKDPYFTLAKKQFLSAKDTIIIDSYHRIDEFSIPKRLTVNNHPAYLSFVQEIPAEHLQEILPQHNTQNYSKAFAAVPGAALPEIHYAQNRTNQFNGAFWVFRKDHTALLYKMYYDFRKTFNQTSLDYTNYTAHSQGINSNFANIIPKDAIDLNQFKTIGKTAYNDSLYFPKDFNHPLLKQTYNQYINLLLNGTVEKDSLPKTTSITYQQFCDSSPLFIWKDPVGRFIQFTDKRFVNQPTTVKKEIPTP